MTIAPLSSCLGDNTVSVLLGDAPADVRLHALAHIQGCEVCRQLVARTLEQSEANATPSTEATWTPSRSAEQESRKADEVNITRGDRIGRYTVIDRVGAGGMGVVYSAYDPELDRRVALKVLRASTGDDDPERRKRLLHEAQVMARLSHPHVLPVYDVGAIDGHVFFTMEFVDGRTLRTWLGESSRGVPEILSLLLRAASGLAAAHQAGIVHLDFKPDNVLVGVDGRVKVSDFGLARSEAMRAGARGRTVVGTPAYMSPEQLGGEDVDARSDIFNFCVVAYEALFGVRPFVGSSLSGLSEAIREQRLQSPSGRGRIAEVGPWLRRAVVRGLAAKPEDRYPTMNALVAALREIPRRRRRRWVATLAALGLAVGVPVLMRVSTRQVRVCAAEARRVEQVWGRPTRDAAAAAFAAVPGRAAADAWATTSRLVDAYAADWSKTATQACLTAAGPVAASAGLANLQRECLGDRLVELGGLTSLLGSATGTGIDRAALAASSLTPLSICEDARMLHNRPERPQNPVVRGRMDALRAEVAALHWRTVMGNAADVRPRADSLAVKAGAEGDRAVQAEALYERGYAEQNRNDFVAADRSYRECVRWAEAAWNKEAAAKCTLGLLVAATRLGHYPEARQWSDIASGMLDALGERNDLRAARDASLAITDAYEARLDDAERLARSADDEIVHIYGADSLRRTGPLDTLAMVRDRQGRPREALAFADRSLTFWESAMGQESPRLVVPLSNVGASHALLGEFERGESLLRQALSIADHHAGAGDEDTAVVSTALSATLWAEGAFEEALHHCRRAVETRERLGPSHPLVADSLYFCALVEADLGDFEGASRDASRGVDIDREAVGDAHPNTALMRASLGVAWLGKGDVARAVAELAASFDVFRQRNDDPSATFQTELELAKAQIAGGHLVIGEQLLTDAETRLQKLDVDPQWVRECSLARVWLLWGHGDYDAARAEAHGVAAYGKRVGRRAARWLRDAREPTPPARGDVRG